MPLHGKTQSLSTPPPHSRIYNVGIIRPAYLEGLLHTRVMLAWENIP